MNIRYLSDNRQGLMGTAMLFVLAFHYALHFGIMDSPIVIRGDIGVDIFLFLSGFGCYYSLSKKNWLEFYKARFKRIYPTFILITLLLFLTNGIIFDEWADIYSLLIDLSGFSYLNHGDLSTWYITAIIILYCVAPLLFKFSNYITLVWLCIIPFLTPIITYPLECNWFDIMNFRIPSFILGLVTGKASLNNEDIQISKIIYIILILLIIGGGNILIHNTLHTMQHSHLRYNIYPALTLSFMYICCYIPQFSITNFFGKYSLEIYLIHQPVFYYLKSIESFPLFFFSTIAITCLGAIVIHQIIVYIYRLCKIK